MMIPYWAFPGRLEGNALKNHFLKTAKASGLAFLYRFFISADQMHEASVETVILLVHEPKSLSTVAITFILSQITPILVKKAVKQYFM